MKIAYLYYDFLNLYGESGNIKAISNALNYNKIKHKIIYLALNDKLDFNSYDLVYIGSGVEENLLIALEYLKPYQEDIKKYIDSGKFMLATGNSVDLFGKTIKTNNKVYDALNIFDYEVIQDNTKRKMEEVYLDNDMTNNKIIGFINNCSEISNNALILKENNFYGTYILGPILVRNPEVLKYFLNNLMNKKLKYNLKIEELAYQTFINNFYKSS